MKLQAGKRLKVTAAVTASMRDTNFVAQELAKALRPLGAKLVKTSANNFFFRTTDKVTVADIVATLAKLPEATAEGGNRVTVNTKSPLGIIYEDTVRVLGNDDPETRMFNILLEA